MDNLEDRVRAALEETKHDKHYNEIRLSAYPSIPAVVGVFAGTLAHNFLNDPGKFIRDLNGGGSPEDLTQGDVIAGYLTGALAYVAASTIDEATRQGGEQSRIRWDVMATPPILAGLAGYVAMSMFDGEKSALALMLALPPARWAQEEYANTQRTYQAYARTPAKRVVHAVAKEYPGAVAMATGIIAGIAGTAIVEAEPISLAIGAGVGTYVGRGIISRIAFRGAEYLRTARRLIAQEMNWTHIVDVDTFAIIDAAAPNRAVFSNLEARAENELKKGNVLAALHAQSLATEISGGKISVAKGYHTVGLPGKPVPEKLVQKYAGQLESERIDYVEKALSLAIGNKEYALAQLYVERLRELRGTSVPELEGMRAMLFDLRGDYKAAQDGLSSFVRTIAPRFGELDAIEERGESRNDVRLAEQFGIPGYIKQVASHGIARQEFELHSAFYDATQGLFIPPIEPVRYNGRSYVFSRSFGTMNMLDLIRANRATADTMMRAADLFVKMQVLSDELVKEGKIAVEDPLEENANFLYDRFERTFVRQLQANGIEIGADEARRMEDAIAVLEPQIRSLPRGYYRDMNPKNVFVGPGGVLMPGDWEVLQRFPIQRDYEKLFNFGGYDMHWRLQNDIRERVVHGTFPFFGLGWQEHIDAFFRGCVVLGPSLSWDMAGYKSGDRARAKNKTVLEFNQMALADNLLSAVITLENLAAEDGFSAQESLVLGEAANAALHLWKRNSALHLARYAIPDKHRPFLREKLSYVSS